MVENIRHLHHDGRTVVAAGIVAAMLAALFGQPLRADDVLAWPPSQAEQEAMYAAAVRDAEVMEPGEARALKTLPEGRVRVVTWTRFPDSYRVGDLVQTDWGPTWVTVVGDVRDRCEAFPRAGLARRLEALLGLPPDDTRRSFVELEVDAADVFRPCGNPSPWSATCDTAAAPPMHDDHRAWLASHYRLALDGAQKYPWTRLGYSYDWALGGPPGLPELGVTEFVIRKGSSVRALSIASTTDYCSR